MKDEIKEILQEIKEKNETYKECSENGIIENEYYKSHKLLDYITNLQEEYEKEHYLVDKLTRQLNDEYKNTEYQCKQKENYKSRNEKAIEYIGSHFKEMVADEEAQVLLNILKGSDNK